MCGTCGCNHTGQNIKIFKPSEHLGLKNSLDSNLTLIESEDGFSPPHHTQTKEDRISRIVKIEEDILGHNNILAQRNRGFLEAKNILSLNLVSSPGSGKTSLLEKTLTDLGDIHKFYVIEGDQQTDRDAERIAKTKTPVIQINTGKACHLDAEMIYRSIKQFNLEDQGILFIENVGNLVCPSLFDLGEEKRVVIISVTEGDDKAIKYPDMFHSSDLCIINKIDLLPYVNFDVDKAKSWARQVKHNLEFIELSATTGEGTEAWYSWLDKQVQKKINASI